MEIDAWTIADIKNRAMDKAYAKVTMLGMEISSNKTDIKTKSYGPLNLEQMLLILEGNKKELQVWEYIAELIENQ
jgi:hypothetical protein